MNKEKQKLVLSGVERIVPALRFPEFENNGEWKTAKLIDIATFSKGKGVSKKDIVSNGKLFCIRYGELYTDYNEVIDKVISKTNLSENELILSKGNEVIIPSSGETRIDIARASCVLREGIALGGDLNIIKSEINGVFFSYYLNSVKKRTIAKMAQGVSVMHLYNSQLEKLEIEFPKPKEQQKIANCLSSLDNLITVETEKLTLLKDHKKGLLQQLFPTNGETKPQFRFPEFKNDGDWVETILDDVADYANGKAHEKEISETGKYKVVNSKFISTEGKVVKLSNSANLKANVGDVLMVLSDIPNGKAIAKCFYVDKAETYTVNQRICKITPTGIDNKFLFYIQNRNKYFLAFDDGVKQTNLRKDTVLSFSFLKPKDPKEQQKIANCLSISDDLIEEQTSKIAALKDHKKGLMQQLFPNVNN